MMNFFEVVIRFFLHGPQAFDAEAAGFLSSTAVDMHSFFASVVPAAESLGGTGGAEPSLSIKNSLKLQYIVPIMSLAQQNHHAALPINESLPFVNSIS